MADDVPSLVAYVGSYAGAGPEAPGEGAGIRTFAVHQGDGSLSPVDAIMPAMEAGYLCRPPGRRLLYAVDERKNDGRGPIGPEASVKAFTIDSDDGRLELINSQPAFGPYPTYVAVDPTGRWVVTASHGSFEHIERVVRTHAGFAIEHLFDDSTLALYPVNEAGALEPACDVRVFDGHGIDPSPSPQVGGHPQAGPHVHSAAFDPAGRFIMACEKSADKIYTFSIDSDARRLRDAHAYRVPHGWAPRHPAFHPTLPWVFVTNEMASTVSSYRYDAKRGSIAHLHTVSTTTSVDTGPENAPADIQVHPNGRLVYVNNRGEDTIAGFRVSEGSGRLTLCASFPLAKSAHPGVGARSFAFDPVGRFLFVADRPANRLLTLAVDAITGELTFASATEVPQPGFVMITDL